MNDEILSIPLDHIRIVNPRFRDRRKFEKIIENIRNLGLKKPILVCPRPDTRIGGQPCYDLVCGQGRVEAFRALGYQEIPALLVEASKEDLLVMSLVENMARRFPSPGDLIVEIDRLKQAGYSNVAIGKKLDMTDTQVGGVLTLRNAGEGRLLSAAIQEKIPLATAIEIARAKGAKAQRELLTAYEDGRLSAAAIKCVKRLMLQRRTAGKGGNSQVSGPKQPCPTADGMVEAFTDNSKTSSYPIKVQS